MIYTPSPYRSVFDGVITKISVSQVECFDPSTSFGCSAKWYFEEVEGRKADGDDPAKRLGEQVHREIERYLKTGENCLGKIALSGKHMIDAVKPYAVGIEYKLQPGDLESYGIPWRGKIDLIWTRDGVWAVRDWKTTSNIAKWGKTRAQVRDSIQMNGYAEFLYRQDADYHGPLLLEHGIMQTKGRNSDLVSVPTDRNLVAKRWTTILDTVKSMMQIAREPTVAKVPFDTRKCEIGHGCPHRDYCPRTSDVFFSVAETLTQAKDDVMSLFSRFSNPAASAAPAAAPTPPSQPVIAQAPAQVSTPPAQVSTPPAQVQSPAANTPPPVPAGCTYIPPGRFPAGSVGPGVVTPDGSLVIIQTYADGGVAARVLTPAATLQPAPAPIPQEPTKVVDPPTPSIPQPPAPPAEEKRGPGRPRTMKIKDIPSESPSAIVAAAQAVKDGREIPGVTCPQITRLVIRQGCTLNMGNYQNAKVEVEMEAVGPNIEAFRPTLSKAVQAALDDECKPYTGKAVSP